MLPLGILALQGDFREHGYTLDAIGVESRQVRTLSDLESVAGLIIPGGESTVIAKLSRAYDLLEPIREKIADGFPAFGTCAGLILLADEILDGIEGQESFGGLDVSVRRNAFGSQLDSFEADLDFAGITGDPVKAAFIRAPIVERVGSDVEVLSALPDGRIVAVQNDHVLGLSFHPEVTGETRIHQHFVSMVKRSN
ncbi:MAG: hypothetical protein RIQ31_891 [Actinomycetota bacterium]